MESNNKGQVITPRERQDEIDRSGMSGLAFARHYGIKYQVFVAWLLGSGVKVRRRIRPGLSFRVQSGTCWNSG